MIFGKSKRLLDEQAEIINELKDELWKLKTSNIGKRMERGDFILYREKSSCKPDLTPARLQSDFQYAMAICDVTGIQNVLPQPRIICGPVKWVHSPLLEVIAITENELLSAPTVEGVKQ